VRLRIDPWATEYGSTLQLDEEVEGPTVSVNPFVETHAWAPITPAEAEPPDGIVFVDGVQRIEAHVLAESDDGGFAQGAFASLGVGAVRAALGPPLISHTQIERTLALTGHAPGDPVAVSCGSARLTFRPHWSTRQGYQGVADAINNKRRDMEMHLGQELVDKGEGLVVLDGRLRLFPIPHTGVVGFTKTMHVNYLPPAQAALLPQLVAGQRTPLFEIDEQRPLYAWFIRLAPTRPIDHPLAGLARLETPAAIGPEEAIALANLTALYLPPFAATPERDPRAPQNLLPIGGLETRLRHEIGDHTWVRRSIETYLYQMAS
jgi:hypothetical protein